MWVKNASGGRRELIRFVSSQIKGVEFKMTRGNFDLTPKIMGIGLVKVILRAKKFLPVLPSVKNNFAGIVSNLLLFVSSSCQL